MLLVIPVYERLMAEPADQQFLHVRREREETPREGIGGDNEPHENSVSYATRGRAPLMARGLLFADLYTATQRAWPECVRQQDAGAYDGASVPLNQQKSERAGL